MIRKGDVIENPITGETMVFLQTPRIPEGSCSRSTCSSRRVAESTGSTATRRRPNACGSSTAR